MSYITESVSYREVCRQLKWDDTAALLVLHNHLLARHIVTVPAICIVDAHFLHLWNNKATLLLLQHMEKEYEYHANKKMNVSYVVTVRKFGTMMLNKL
jgi:hypothetical protein